MKYQKAGVETFVNALGFICGGKVLDNPVDGLFRPNVLRSMAAYESDE